MIPKNLVTAWFGRGQKSDLFKRCIDSWHKIHPDWSYIEINEDTLSSKPLPYYIEQVLARGEFVKATELARLLGVFLHGGIYMDCDVEVIKPLDSLLEHQCFFVRQKDGLVNGAMFGAEPGNQKIGHIITMFPTMSDGRDEAVRYGPVFLTSAIGAMVNPPTIIDTRIAFPYDYTEEDPSKYPDVTLAVHRWAGSWKVK